MPPYPGTVALADDLERIAAAAAAHADGDDGALRGILAAEPAAGVRIYVCAFESADGTRSWLALDDDGAPVVDRTRACGTPSRSRHSARSPRRPRSAGDLDELRAQLVALRITEEPDGIDEAEAAARGLQHVLGAPPHLASPARLDEIGRPPAGSSWRSTPPRPSPFAAAMRSAVDVAEALWADVARRLPGLARLRLEAWKAAGSSRSAATRRRSCAASASSPSSRPRA